MASNQAPLMALEREQVETQPNVVFIYAWAKVRQLTTHPVGSKAIQIKAEQVNFKIISLLFY